MNNQDGVAMRLASAEREACASASAAEVGTSVATLRKTYVHYDLDESDWAHLRSFGAVVAD